uniref:Uncharacterized protein n=2 Tax=Micrurus TaxID=8634 RepID=A0A2D4LQP3_9SAUR
MWKTSSSCSQQYPLNKLTFLHLFLNMTSGKMDHTILTLLLQTSDSSALPLFLIAQQSFTCCLPLPYQVNRRYLQSSEIGLSSPPLLFFYNEIVARTQAIRKLQGNELYFRSKYLGENGFSMWEHSFFFYKMSR